MASIKNSDGKGGGLDATAPARHADDQPPGNGEENPEQNRVGAAQREQYGVNKSSNDSNGARSKSPIAKADP